MDVSLGALRQRLLNFRSWDSSGKTLDDRIREALNTSLDRLAGDVPEALVPDEQHIALRPDVEGSTYDAKVLATLDQRVLQFYGKDGKPLGSSTSTWTPTLDGTWDGIMHIEFTDTNGQLHRRQCLEFFKLAENTGSQDVPTWVYTYFVTIDRPWSNPSGSNSVSNMMDFRLHQPEFFLRDDVMEVLEPARIFDGTRQQVWSIDTAGAYRQDMLDYRGESTGRPYRMWRGRHFQLPAPSDPPDVAELIMDDETHLVTPSSLTERRCWGHGDVFNAYSTGEWGICYTYVWGRRDKEWQQSPSINGDKLEVKHDFHSSDTDPFTNSQVVWAHESYRGTLGTGHNTSGGVYDPVWESAPSPIAVIKNTVNFKSPVPPTAGDNQKPDGSKPPVVTPGTGEAEEEGLPAGAGSKRALIFAATNIDEILGFQSAVAAPGSTDSAWDFRKGRTGYRIRYYISQISSNRDRDSRQGEVSGKYYMLCEVEPTYDQLYTEGSIFADETSLNQVRKDGARIIWNGDQLYDYNRPLRHSTGYYAYKVYPHQDARYELDFRVLRLPRKYQTDSDTAPIQRDAIPTLIELALYYLCLMDGVDQQGAQLHLDRYTELARKYRERYANPGRVVEPVPMFGYSARHRYGTFGSTSE